MFSIFLLNIVDGSCVYKGYEKLEVRIIKKIFFLGISVTAFNSQSTVTKKRIDSCNDCSVGKGDTVVMDIL